MSDYTIPSGDDGMQRTPSPLISLPGGVPTAERSISPLTTRGASLSPDREPPTPGSNPTATPARTPRPGPDKRRRLAAEKARLAGEELSGAAPEGTPDIGPAEQDSGARGDPAELPSNEVLDTPPSDGEETEPEGSTQNPPHIPEIAPTLPPVAANAHALSAHDSTARPGLGHNHPPETVDSPAPSNVPVQPKLLSDPLFPALMERAAVLARDDTTGILGLLIDARCLAAGETALLQAKIAASTKLSMAVIGGFVRDAASHSTRFGIIRNLDDVVGAFETELKSDFWPLAVTEGLASGFRNASPNQPESETGYWQALPTEMLERRLLNAFPGVAAVQAPSDRKEALRRLYLRYLRADDFFSAAAPGLNLGNGFLRLNEVTGEVELVEHGHQRRARYRLPIAYTPGAECSRFIEGLNRAMGNDQQKVATFTEFLACTLFGLRPARDMVRNVMILFGPQRTGKSTLIRLLERFVPNYARASISPELWGDQFHRAKLRGILLNTATELPAKNRTIMGSWFKTVASAEPITARAIYGDSVTFTPLAKHVFACNGLPRLDDGDSSIGRRLIVIRMANTLEQHETDSHFLDNCWAEAPGIVNELARAAERVIAAERYTLPLDNDELVLRMQFSDQPEEHVARRWLETASGERVWGAELQIALRTVAQDLGIDTGDWRESTGMKPLSALMTLLYGATRHIDGGKPFYRGVRFRSDVLARISSVAPDPSESNHDPIL